MSNKKEYSEQDLINKRMAKARKIRMANLANKGNKTYLNRKWLFSRSCIDRMSLDDIGKLCGVEYDVIWEALKRLKIPIIIMVGSEKWYDWVEQNKEKILALKS